MTVVFVTHLCCAASFIILAVLALAGRERSRIGNFLAAAAAATVVWALAEAYEGALPPSVVAIIESVRSLAWLLFLQATLEGEGGARGTLARTASRAVLAVGGLAILIDAAGLGLAPTTTVLSQPQLLARIAVDVLALSLVENLYRNTPADQRWTVIPTAIAAGAIFAFDLFFHADGLISRTMSPALTAARALADVIAVPLLVLAMVRTRNWRPSEIRMSHQAAFHAVTLISSGIFLLSVALVGMLFRYYGGDWGVIVQITSLFGAAVVLVTVLSSETARSGIRLAILRNFFSYRYDYRVEWLRCIEALSAGDAAADLPERVVRALADIVNSPGGVLFQRRDTVYQPTASWNAHVAPGAREDDASAFIAEFRGGRWIQELGRAGAAPAWLEAEPFWLAVPLPRQGAILGFVVLVKPRAPVHPDWEVFDLLRTMASQAAAYLFQQQAERALADAQVLQEYSRRFAFVVHDIKNLSSQLGLILSNARRHGNNPEFQADVLHTVENSVSRMNKLLSQLKVTAALSAPAESPVADALGLVREIVAGHPHRDAIEIIAGPEPGLHVAMDPTPLRSVVSHLINNACEASGPAGRVKVSLGTEDERVTIDISDEGPGMEISFVRNELFRPFRSTKDSGLGIGAYQARELIRGAGGQLDVVTRPGSGTTMRVMLPPGIGPARVSPAA